MAATRGLFGSSLARKYWMALTGLFLSSFLIIHLIGNLPILFGDQEAFNLYAAFMTSFPPIKAVSYLLYGSILLHAIDGIFLMRQNKVARPEAYVSYNGKANATWASRNMGLLGIFTLLFLIIHMRSFWYEMHFGHVPTMDIEGAQVKDLYTMTIEAFHQLWYVILYVVCMIMLGFHLSHGMSSAFQTLGLNHPKYTPAIEKAGRYFAWIMALGFAIIPAYVYLQHLTA
ncbi:MAG: succinate dehydrogenase [Bacteroidetes bacterium]|nr:succinate dehydrogenase [Bacteroidota bacterium]